MADPDRPAATTQLENAKTSAAEAAAGTAEVLDHTASDFSSHGQDILAEGAGALASAAAGLADEIEHRGFDELLRDVGRFARSNPAVCVAGGIALGVLLARFASPSSRYEAGDYEGGDFEGGWGWDERDDYGDSMLPPDVEEPGAPGASYGNPELAALGIQDRDTGTQRSPGTVEGPVRSEGAPGTEGAPRP